MRKLLRGRTLLATMTAAILIAGGGIAWADFLSSGSGRASGVAGTVQLPIATGVLKPGEKLYPGVRRTIRVTVANPNDFTVTVYRVDKSTASSVLVDSAHAAGCTVTGVSLTNPPYAVSWKLTAHQTRTFDLTNGMRMTNASSNGCQGATFTVPMVIYARA